MGAPGGLAEGGVGRSAARTRARERGRARARGGVVRAEPPPVLLGDCPRAVLVPPDPRIGERLAPALGSSGKEGGGRGLVSLSGRSARPRRKYSGADPNRGRVPPFWARGGGVGREGGCGGFGSLRAAAAPAGGLGAGGHGGWKMHRRGSRRLAGGTGTRGHCGDGSCARGDGGGWRAGTRGDRAYGRWAGGDGGAGGRDGDAGTGMLSRLAAAGPRARRPWKQGVRRAARPCSAQLGPVFPPFHGPKKSPCDAARWSRGAWPGRPARGAPGPPAPLARAHLPHPPE